MRKTLKLNCKKKVHKGFTVDYSGLPTPMPPPRHPHLPISWFGHGFSGSVDLGLPLWAGCGHRGFRPCCGRPLGPRHTQQPHSQTLD